LCCGYDSGVPVTPDYVAPFTFTGQIEQVVVETEEVGSIDLEAQIRTAFTDQ
jgi:arylsulfatase